LGENADLSNGRLSTGFSYLDTLWQGGFLRGGVSFLSCESFELMEKFLWDLLKAQVELNRSGVCISSCDVDYVHMKSLPIFASDFYFVRSHHIDACLEQFYIVCRANPELIILYEPYWLEKGENLFFGFYKNILDKILHTKTALLVLQQGADEPYAHLKGRVYMEKEIICFQR